MFSRTDFTRAAYWLTTRDKLQGCYLSKSGFGFSVRSRRPCAQARCESDQMKNEIPANPAYRRVVADLRDCEERYATLLESTSATDDSGLASALAAIKSEVRQR